jgi:hypothetical protein
MHRPICQFEKQLIINAIMIYHDAQHVDLTLLTLTHQLHL